MWPEVIVVQRKSSIFFPASSKDKNQLTERHSSLNFPLNDSTYGLSVGFPGLEKSSVTSFESAHKSISLERSAAADKFASIIALNALREASFYEINFG